MNEQTWRIVAADDDHEWPCTIVDSNGKSLLGVHNGTPIIRDRALADQILALLNASTLPSSPTTDPASVPGRAGARRVGGEVSANIRRGQCANDCRVTWHSDHGPDRSEPGTRGEPGDVRRCEHGRIWAFERTAENRYYCEMDLWRRISRFWEPVTYRRAVKALEAEATQ